MNKPVSPLDNLQEVCDSLEPGDILYLSEGVYSTRGVVLTRSGTSEAPIRIEGLGNVVFDGASLIGSAMAVDAIKDRTDLDEVKADIGEKAGYHSKAAFTTNGQKFIQFVNLSANRMKAVVDSNLGSSDLLIENIRADGSRFAVVMNGVSNVTVQGALVVNCWNGFRAFGVCKNLYFENIDVSGSKDVWYGIKTYLNGDGFTFEAEVDGLTLKNIRSHDNWDAGFDIKAKNVLMTGISSYRNKNNYKPWGENIVVEDSDSYDAKSQSLIPEKLGLEGNGVTVQKGGKNIVFKNVLFHDNEGDDIRVYAEGSLELQGCTYTTFKVDSGGVLIKDGVTPVPILVPTPKPKPAPKPKKAKKVRKPKKSKKKRKSNAKNK